MKTKKILFNISGTLKCVASSFLILLFGMILLLNGIIKKAFVSNSEFIQQLIDEMVAIDGSMAYLYDMSAEEIVDIVMQPVIALSIALIVMSIFGIILGIFNFIFAKKYDTMLENKTRMKILFTILSFLFYWGLISNVLTVIALFTKDINSKNENNASNNLNQNEIENSTEKIENSKNIETKDKSEGEKNA